MIILFLALVTCAIAADQTYYLDVRWDNMVYNNTWNYTGDISALPFDHGLRILPAIYLARQKLYDGMELVPTPRNLRRNLTKVCEQQLEIAPTSKFWLNLMEIYSLKECGNPPLNPVSNRSSSECDGWSNQGVKDIGECLGWDKSCTAARYGGTDYALFKKQKFIADGDFMNFTFPLNSLNYKDTDYYANMLKETSGVTGILGSTDGAAIAAKVARARKVPHIVPHVTDAMGNWPLSADDILSNSNFDNSFVVGFDSFQIQDILHEIIREGLESSEQGSMQNYSIQIIHEGGHNRILANKLTHMFSDRLDIQLNYHKSIPGTPEKSVAYATPQEILLNEANFYGLIDDEASTITESELAALVKGVKDQGRFIILMGKRKMFRDILRRFKDEEMNPEHYQIILIPENGGPCTSFWEKQVNETDTYVGDRDDDIRDMLQNQIAICHNGHNRKWHEWEYNYWSKHYQRKYTGGEPLLLGEMAKWDEFSNEFKDIAINEFGYDVPEGEEISHLAAFAHDSVIWAAFLNTQRNDLPEWFKDAMGDYTQDLIFQRKKDDFANLEKFPLGDIAGENYFGWGNMFGRHMFKDADMSRRYRHKYNMTNSDTMITGCCGVVSESNSGQNAFNIKRNRVRGDALGVTVMNNQTWHYTRQYGFLRDDDTFYGQLKTQKKALPMDDVWRDVSRPECDYDGHLCLAMEKTENLLWLIIIVVVVVLCVVVILAFIFYKKQQYRRACGAMTWRLDYDSIDFDVAGAGIRSSMLGGGTQGTQGTVGTVGTQGTRGTMGTQGTMGTMGTRGNTRGLDTRGTMGTQGTGAVATFQTLGTNMSLGSEQGRKNQAFAKLAVHQAKRCAVKDLDDDWSTLCTKTPSFALLQEMKEVTDLIHDNIVNFLGICYTNAMDHPVCLMEYCTRGSLQDLLEDEDVVLDNNFKFSFIIDLIKGMRFLHSNAHIKSHGYLKSTNCLITAQFGLKIGDYGEVLFRSDAHRVEGLEKIARDNRKLTQAPELLRSSEQVLKGTKKGDVYSIGIIIHEIIERKGPYGTSSDDCMMSAGEILEMIVTPPYGRSFRPSFSLTMDDKVQAAKAIAESCWVENPPARPDVFHLENEISKLQDEDLSLAQRMIRRMERFVRDMERMKKSHESTKAKNVTIYHKMQQELLPDKLIEKITVGQDTPPETHASVSVLSLQIMGFYEALKQCPENEAEVWSAIEHMNNSACDMVKSKGFFKLRSDMEKFVIIANAGESCQNHAAKIYDFVDDFRFYMSQNLNLAPNVKRLLQVKAGICTGPLTTVVLPGKHPRLQAYGETVVVAEALRECASESECLIADSTQSQLSTRKDIKFEKVTSIKHKDLAKTAIYSAQTI